MMPPLRIAVVGCGTGGAATALRLAPLGHQITLFERFHEPRPVGAGLLLQPTGLSVLAELGLFERILDGGAIIRRLHGVNRRGRSVLDLRYADLAEGCFGVGIHRARLFGALFDALLQSPVELRLGIQVEDVKQAMDAAWVCSGGEEFGPFDLVIAADGSHSALRRALGHEGATRPYPWAALWAIVPDPESRLTDTLVQTYDGARRMIGLLPAGRDPSGTPQVTLYWSLRGDGYQRWLADGLPAWKHAAIGLAPTAEPLLEALTLPEQLTFSRYNDVRPSRWREGRLLYLGDAAHGTSPQLGQGANLALWDAKVLAECLAAAPLDEALRQFEALRRPVVRYYQWASRWLTPFFQSDGRLLPLLRDTFMPSAGRLPGLRRYALETLTGTRGGFIRRLPVDFPLGERAAESAEIAVTRVG